MGMMRWWFAAGLLTSVGLSHAGDIYTCKGANGVNTYQNTPCPKPESQLQHSTYDASLARPGTPPPDAAEQPVQQGEVNQAPPRAVADSSAPRQNTPPAAYRCTAGNRTWIQRTPCPATYREGQSVDVDGRTMEGQMVRGTGWIDVEKPVQQQVMSQDALCDQVRAGARIGQGGSSASQSYERNKLKRNLCGG